MRLKNHLILILFLFLPYNTSSETRGAEIPFCKSPLHSFLQNPMDTEHFPRYSHFFRRAGARPRFDPQRIKILVTTARYSDQEPRAEP
ncbi:hypothetical protein V2G26_017210 [Clonostachys chloroleuca]